MFRTLPTPEDEAPARNLVLVIVSLVMMSILFGFSAADLGYRLRHHGNLDGSLTTLFISVCGMFLQCVVLRKALRRLRAQAASASAASE